MNFGGGFGIYVASVAIYAVKHDLGEQSIWDRVDNFGLILILLTFAFTRLRRDSLFRARYFIVIISFYILFTLLQTQALGLLNWFNFAAFMRMYGLPFTFLLVLRVASLSPREIRSFSAVMLILGAYMAIVSILERLGMYSIIIPPWIGDPNLNETIGSGRSGGPLLQPEFNGFTLSLISCIILGMTYIDRSRYVLLKYAICLLCVIGVLFTYTRGAWVAVALASPFLLLRPSSVLGGNMIKRFALFSIMLLLAGFLILFPSRQVRERTGDTGTIYYRVNLWVAALTMAVQKPILGHGIKQFEKEVSDYQVSTNLAPEMIIPEEGTGTHNVFLNVLIEQGVLGLILYLSIILQIYLKARASARANWLKGGSVWVFVFTIIYFVNAQFVNIHDPVTNLIYFGTMGMLAGLSATGGKMLHQ
jgi:O-antigen ligase